MVQMAQKMYGLSKESTRTSIICDALQVCRHELQTFVPRSPKQRIESRGFPYSHVRH
jgi:hypothetical protein